MPFCFNDSRITELKQLARLKGKAEGDIAYSQLRRALASPESDRNLSLSYSTARQFWRIKEGCMTVVGVVWLGSVSLWMLKEFDGSNR